MYTIRERCTPSTHHQQSTPTMMFRPPGVLPFLLLSIFAISFVRDTNAFVVHHQNAVYHERPASSFLFSTPTSTDTSDHKNMETMWRHVKKPLLSVSGKKGVTTSHGNSLRELLEAHTAVKVKVRGFASLDEAFAQLAAAATARGAPAALELLQARSSDAILLIGLPGTRERIEEGTFPPKPKPPRGDAAEEENKQPLGIR